MKVPSAHRERQQDLRWSARATADLILSKVLTDLVGERDEYSSLVKTLGSVRHMRTAVQGRFSHWIEERHHQCNERTGQRAQSVWRDQLIEHLQHEVLFLFSDLERSAKGPVELHQKELQYLLNLGGWQISQIFRNRILHLLVDRGQLVMRRERDLCLYTRVPPLAPSVQASADSPPHLVRVMGGLAPSMMMRLEGDRRAMFWMMGLQLSPAHTRELALQLAQRYREILARESLPWSAAMAGEDLCWVRCGVASGPSRSRSGSARDEHRTQIPMPIAVLSGDVSHLVGDVPQSERALRRYLLEHVRPHAEERGLSLDAYLASFCGLQSSRTVQRWLDAPLLMSEEGAQEFSGSISTRMACEMIRELGLAWPAELSRRTLQDRITEQFERIRDAESLVTLAFGILEGDPRVQRKVSAHGRESFLLRIPLPVLSHQRGNDQLLFLQQRLHMVSALVEGALCLDPSFEATSGQFLMRMDGLEKVVDELKQNRDELYKEAFERHYNHEQGPDAPSGATEHLLLSQLCLTPFYPERMGSS